jgi:hypothetical protein
MQKTLVYKFTVGIFLRFEGILGMEKSLHLPIKGGVMARVKGAQLLRRVQTFRDSLSPSLS